MNRKLFHLWGNEKCVKIIARMCDLNKVEFGLKGRISEAIPYTGWQTEIETPTKIIITFRPFNIFC